MKREKGTKERKKAEEMEGCYVRKERRRKEGRKEDA